MTARFLYINIQIGLLVIRTGHATLKRDYDTAFYIPLVTLKQFLKERPIFHVEKY